MSSQSLREKEEVIYLQDIKNYANNIFFIHIF